MGRWCAGRRVHDVGARVRGDAGEGEPAAGTVARGGELGYLPQDPRDVDLDELARDRILSARGIGDAVRRMRSAEQRMADPDHAAAMSALFIDELLAHGTTAACVFPSVHKVSVDALFGAAQARGMRLIAGKVLMIFSTGRPTSNGS